MAGIKYLITTAYRDSRKDRGKLALFMSAIILGIAALVAINSFNYNLVKDIDEQSKSILGADMSVTGNQPIAEHLQLMLCLLYTSPSPRDQRGSRMPSSA